MTQSVQTEGRPEQIEDLLPWYATGKISKADRARVDQALQDNPELARRLQLVNEEISHVAHGHEQIAAPSSRAFDQLMAGIAAEPKRAPVLVQAKQGLLDWFGSVVAALSPRTLAYAACAAVGVIAVQSIALTGIVGGGNSTYNTASAPVVSSGAFAMVSFAPAAKAQDITVFLKQFNATIVDGPRASGMFKIKIGETKLAKADVGRILEAMKKENAIIGFVASAD
jgi:anti-sigma factor RsiW